MEESDRTPSLTRRSLLALGGYGLLMPLVPPALCAAPAAVCAEDRAVVLGFLARVDHSTR
jgi:hypothetical protein